jgi:hypothetical protein
VRTTLRSTEVDARDRTVAKPATMGIPLQPNQIGDTETRSWGSTAGAGIPRTRASPAQYTGRPQPPSTREQRSRIRFPPPLLSTIRTSMLTSFDCAEGHREGSGGRGKAGNEGKHRDRTLTSHNTNRRRGARSVHAQATNRVQTRAHNKAPSGKRRKHSRARGVTSIHINVAYRFVPHARQ